MTRYEYKVVPAPQKGTKAKGVRTPEGRFANSVEQVLNRMAASGWEYLRAELLPNEERSGLTGSTTQWRNVLVFRRAMEGDDSPVEPDDVPPEPILIAPHADDETEPEPINEVDGGETETNEDTSEDHPASGLDDKDEPKI
ncbi:MAG: DUF4177 domain-containing protein [Paracoccaceae bacterium]